MDLLVFLLKHGDDEHAVICPQFDFSRGPSLSRVKVTFLTNRPDAASSASTSNPELPPAAPGLKAGNTVLSEELARRQIAPGRYAPHFFKISGDDIAAAWDWIPLRSTGRIYEAVEELARSVERTEDETREIDVEPYREQVRAILEQYSEEFEAH
uniref:Uncharacterized protein n=1 Tax=Mycena chlorophos TaxID=658473 RepID=A0ABQ0LD48_MYCCL|nr:predicted protein [Mycena chlorophos]